MLHPGGTHPLEAAASRRQGYDGTMTHNIETAPRLHTGTRITKATDRSCEAEDPTHRRLRLLTAQIEHFGEDDYLLSVAMRQSMGMLDQLYYLLSGTGFAQLMDFAFDAYGPNVVVSRWRPRGAAESPAMTKHFGPGPELSEAFEVAWRMMRCIDSMLTPQEMEQLIAYARSGYCTPL